jgi:hypothetical protein
MPWTHDPIFNEVMFRIGLTPAALAASLRQAVYDHMISL